MTAVIAITSGQANAGKTLLSANLAHYLNQKGFPTGVLVAGSEKPLWNVSPNTTWPNIIGGRLSIDLAIKRNVFGVDLMVIRGHGHALGNLSTQTAENLADPLGILNSYAYLIVDMATMASSPAIAGCLAATEAIMMLTADTSALKSGYEWLAKLTQHDFKGPVNIILNRIGKPAVAQSAYELFRDLAKKRLNIQSNLWGTMTLEKQLAAADILGRPLADLLPQCQLLQEIMTIGDRLLAEQPPENQTLPLSIFWQHFIQRLEKLPPLPMTPPLSNRPSRKSQQPPKTSGEVTNPLPSAKLQSQSDRQLLLHLNSQMTAIFEELRAIRKAMQSASLTVDGTAPKPEPSMPEEVSIDFDNFVSSQKNENP